MFNRQRGGFNRPNLIDSQRRSGLGLLGPPPPLGGGAFAEPMGSQRSQGPMGQGIIPSNLALMLQMAGGQQSMSMQLGGMKRPIEDFARRGGGYQMKRRRDDEPSRPYDSSRHRPGKSKGEEDYDPSKPTDEDPRDQDDLFCSICKIAVWDKESMERHINGNKHKAVVDHKARGGPVSVPPYRSKLQREYCKTCSKWFVGTFDAHKSTQEHEDNQRQKIPSRGVPQKSAPTGAQSKPVTSSTPNRSTDVAKEEEVEIVRSEDVVIPDYVASRSFGREYVIPVSGFFCRLCHKFYNVESTAFEIHCKSRAHYEKVVSALEEKKRFLTDKSENLSGEMGREDGISADDEIGVEVEGSPTKSLKEMTDMEADANGNDDETPSSAEPQGEEAVIKPSPKARRGRGKAL